MAIITIMLVTAPNIRPILVIAMLMHLALIRLHRLPVPVTRPVRVPVILDTKLI